MKKFKLSLALSIIFLYTSLSFAQSTLEWVKRVNIGASSQTAYDVATDSLGNIYITGSHSKGYSETDMVTVKYNSSGHYQWAKTYNFSSDYTSEFGKSISLYRNGNKTYIYVAGEVYLNGGINYITIIKYDSDGNQIWQRNYEPGIPGGNDVVAKVLTDASGNCIVAGTAFTNPFIVKYDSLGVNIFASVVSMPGAYTYSQANDMDIDASGNIYATGSADTSNTKHFLTFKLNSTGTLQWLKFYKSAPTYTSSGRSIKVGKTGRIYVTGDNYNASTGNDILTIKYNQTTGDTVWTKKYNRTSNSNEESKVLALDANDNIYISGISYFGSYSDIYNIKYDSLGVQKWVKTYNGPGGYSDIPKDINCDNSGNIYVAGISDNSYFGSYVTIKYNSLGDSLWTRRQDFSSAEFEVANAMSLDINGNVIVTGTLGNSGTDFGTVKYNSSGANQWAVKFYGAQIIEDRANGIARDKNGNVYTVGKAKTGQGGDNIIVVKYDPQGVQKWVYNTGGTFAGYNAYDEGKAIAVDSNGYVYFTGTVYNHPSTKNDICTGKLDSNGNRLWHSVWVPTGPTHGDDTGNDIIVDTLGNVYITGQYSNSAGNLDYLTIKYNSAGVEQWVRGYSGIPGGKDIPNAITLDRNLNVFITGVSDGSGTGTDIATIKYSNPGVQQWIKIFNNPENTDDFGNDIGTDTSGHVYVCGGVDSNSLSPNAILLKYLNGDGTLRGSKYRNDQSPGGVAYFNALAFNPSKTLIFATGTDRFSSTEIGEAFLRCDTGFVATDLYYSIPHYDKDVEGKSIAWHDNYLYIGGNSFTQAEGKRMFVVRRTEYGNPIFTEYLNVNSPSGMTSNNGIVGGKGNNVFAAGNTYDSTSGNNITTLKYSYPYFRLLTSYSLEGPQSAFPIGFQDTVRVYLRSTVAPYTIVDSAKGVNEYSSFVEYMYVYSYFNNVTTTGTYYVVLKHRNSIETWSKPKQLFNDVIPQYRFVDSLSQAYGSNLKLLTVNPYPLYGFYSGDVNQDGTIDLTDVITINNDANIFSTGYLNSDVNGNNATDLSDVLIALNNANIFVSVIRP